MTGRTNASTQTEAVLYTPEEVRAWLQKEQLKRELEEEAKRIWEKFVTENYLKKL